MGVEQVETGRDTLALRCRVATLDPEAVFAYWTQPKLLTQWWPKAAEIDGRVGGDYHLRWPAMGWHLHGRYLAFDPPRLLAFTWAWEHEPEAPVAQVRVELAPHPEGGTAITLTHGPYDDSPESQAMREGHRAGWVHFCQRLQDVAAPA